MYLYTGIFLVVSLSLLIVTLTDEYTMLLIEWLLSYEPILINTTYSYVKFFWDYFTNNINNNFFSCHSCQKGKKVKNKKGNAEVDNAEILNHDSKDNILRFFKHWIHVKDDSLNVFKNLYCHINKY